MVGRHAGEIAAPRSFAVVEPQRDDAPVAVGT